MVALRDGRCDNDDATFESITFPYVGILCEYIMLERSGSRGVARCSRGCSFLVALRDGRCDNDDATFQSVTLPYIGILCGIYNVGAFWQSWCRSLFEKAQFAWSRFVTGAVKMTTRHSISFCSYYVGGWVIVTGEAEVAACRLSFDRAQLLRRAMR